MSVITWIVIVLIVLSILVSVTEVGLRFALLHTSQNKKNSALAAHRGRSDELGLVQPPRLLASRDPDQVSTDSPSSDLEVLAKALGLTPNATLADITGSIRDLKQQGQSCATSSTDSLRSR
jgi:hypothetical protein